jgi:3-oxoacyl-[acyl-carrier protein] reductase
MKVLIVGGSSDIGISLAKYLKEKNNQVIITYNNNTIDITDIDTVHCDVTKEEEIDKIFKKLGRIDCLINMAAISRDNLLLDSNKVDFMDTLEVNLVGSYLTSKIYNKYNDNGLIINIASTDGIDTYNEYNMFYAVSKAGLIHLSKCLSLSMNNKVYCICPNLINSNSTREIDKDYLDNELKRIKQSRLIEIDELCDSIYKIINMNEKSGTVFRIDIKGDKLWIEKVS